MDLIEWIECGLRRPGKSRAGLAAALGLPTPRVTEILGGRRRVQLEELPRIAEYLGISLMQLSTIAEMLVGSYGFVPVRGAVAAGVWREPALFDEITEHYRMTIDPKWPSDAVFMVRVTGQSINRRAAAGDLALCLSCSAAPREIADGDWLVVERRRDQLVERTIKRAKQTPAGVELWPHSDDPRYQVPIRFGDHPGEEVSVVAFVLDFVSPATKF